VPTLSGSDDESSSLIYKVKSLPSNAKLYCDGAEVTAVDTTCAPDKLKVDPDDGDLTVTFTYTTTDEAGVESDEATVTMPFADIKISGHIFHDGDGNGNINGDAINNPDGVQLYATLVDSSNSAVATKAVANDGTYIFSSDDGISPNTTYTVVLSTEANATTPSLPENWNNADGEQASNSGTGNDGSADGKLTVELAEANLPDNDFGINKKPVAEDVSEVTRTNLGGSKQYSVPDLNVSDLEDTTPTTITIKTVPNNGKLYYDNAEVTASQVIPNFDANKLTVDPDDGKQSVVFTYTTTDRAGVESDEAKVTMPFVPPVEVGDFVWEDTNKNGLQDAGESGIENVKVILSEGSDCSNKIAETTTDADGKYIFNHTNVNANSNNPGLEANTDYTVCIDSTNFTDSKGVANSPLERHYLTSKDSGDDSADSDAKIANGLAMINLTTGDIGDINHTHDFGFVKTVALGDTIWVDYNHNGVQDSEDVNTSEEITVTLLDENGNPAKDYQGNAVAPITTTDGSYKFIDLDPGKYQVKFTLPNGYIATLKDQGGNEAKDSDIDPTTLTTDAIDVQDDNSDIDAGIFKEACIGDYFWDDKNANGIQEDGESGVEGVKLELFDAQGSSVATTETNSTGGYKFCGLVRGDYQIKVTLPAGYYVSRENKGGDNTKDSDAKNFLGVTATIDTNLEFGEKDNTLDGGVFKPASIGDFVWNDDNANGVQDDTESGLVGVHVTLTDAQGNKVTDVNGAEVKITDTNSTGGYLFIGLIPGEYKVSFKADPDANGAPYLSTKANEGDDSKDSDIPSTVIGGGESPTVTVTSGEKNPTIDAGFIQKICLGDSVWEDKNANGIKEAGDNPLAKVEVSITYADGSEVKDVYGNSVTTTETNTTGEYEFCNLFPARDYKLTFKKPDGYYVTFKDKGDDEQDSDIDRDTISVVVTDPVVDTMNIDAGFFRPAKIGSFIWEDTNANGIQEDGENGIKDVEVTLLNPDGSEVKDASGNVVQTITTDANGEYIFTNLIPREYKIKVVAPDGYYVTRKDKGDDDSKDSDINPTFNAKEGTTEPTTLESGEEDRTWDAGFFKSACIGESIWEDKNANGIQEEDESGVAGVTLTLVDGTGASVTDVNGNALTAITTAEDGKYSFCNLVPGEYQVKVTTLPDGYLLTRENQGSDDSKDSDVNTFLATTGDMPKETLSSDEHNMTFDGGVFKPACIGNFVWKDKNANGIQDEDELGIEGVHVTINPLADQYGNQNLKDVMGNDLGTIDTDTDGKYEYCNLIPGKYSVSFKADPDANGAPYITTAQDKGGDDTKDSDIPEFVESVGTTPEVTLQSGINNTTLDAGYIQEICLGSKVWFDENLNGIQDKDELGVVDIKVILTYADGSAVTNVYGESVKLTKTDKDGNYKYCHLYPARDYKIHFDIPESYHPTLKDKGSDLKDSDANRNGDIIVKYPVRDDYTLDTGIYCDCDDYLVHPEEHKELKMPAMNILGLVAMLTALFMIVRRED